MSTWIFWGSFGLLAHHYLIYPAVVLIVARLKTKNLIHVPPLEPRLPFVSLIIAAYNEEKVIGQKLANSIALDYPADMFEVIVVSDGSNDATASIVEQFSTKGVVSMHTPERLGKTAALNRGVSASRGEIVVFSDANNDFNPGAIRALIKNFVDPSVGGVCGIKRIRDARDRESSEGDSLYWRYESAIKLAESQLGTITNGDGEIFAVRRELYEPMDTAVINDDAELTLNIVKKGYRVLYEPGAESLEFASIEIGDDFNVKVRMIAGGFQTIVRHAAFLLPPRSWFTFAFFSHKMLRWTSPVWLLTMLVASIFLVDSPLYQLLLLAQLAFYALAFFGWLMRKQIHLPTLVYVPFYFSTMNLAALFGLIRHLRQTQNVNWQKAKR